MPGKLYAAKYSGSECIHVGAILSQVWNTGAAITCLAIRLKTLLEFETPPNLLEVFLEVHTKVTLPHARRFASVPPAGSTLLLVPSPFCLQACYMHELT